MPRPRNGVHHRTVVHAVNRGNDRRTLFFNDSDYRAFLGLLTWASTRASLPLLGYVVMPNHWHLVVWPNDSSHLSQFMHRLTGSHAAILRKQTGTTGTGHIYQDRYRARLVTSELQYVRTLRYVEANPVRAGLVDRAEHWRWSSLRERTERRWLVSEGPARLPPLTTWLALVNVPLEPRHTAALDARRPRLGIARLWPGSE